MLYIILCLIVLTVIWVAYFGVFECKERRAIKQFIQSHDLNKLEKCRASSNQVVELIRETFNSDYKTFKHLNIESRSFLRESTLELLRHKEGLCGEGTRVITKILLRLGYDATRITLFTRDLRSAHTLVSVKLDGNDFFADSINTMESAHKMISDSEFSIKDFSFIDYGQHSLTGGKGKEEGYKPLLEKYWLYSFEALPLTKLLQVLKFKIRVFNHHRPPVWLSYLAESPYMVKTVLGFLTLSLLVFLGGLVWLL